ncbi:hypothetical protein AB0K00_03200 [Dactylosporangium sp. NPDC049525]|uniref:hypothetical protein n=1 Tax=Dactylosporangium sp. NPDC049525 TaxID=3154730 RepID=UPI00341D71C2
MNNFDWDFDDQPTRGTDVRRRLMLDHRSYDVTAFDDGTGVVGLRLVGWDSGYVFTELVAELPTGDATDVGQLLASALAGFRGGGSPPGSPPPGSTPSGGWRPYDSWSRDPRPTAPKSGQPWEPADLELLVRRFREGATIKTLTVELGRTDGAIRQRLQILGEVRPAPTADVDPPADGSGGAPEAVSKGSIPTSAEAAAGAVAAVAEGSADAVKASAAGASGGAPETSVEQASEGVLAELPTRVG